MAVNYKAMEDSLGLESGILSQAAEKEELVDVDLSGLKVFKNTDYEQLINNHNLELKEKESYSKQVGEEEILKLLRDEFLDSDFEGRKNKDKVIQAIKAKKLAENGIDQNVEVKEALEKLEAYEKVIAQKDKDIEEQRNRYEETVQKYKQKEDYNFITSKLKDKYGSFKDKISLNEQDSLELFLNRNDLKLEDGVITPYKNGEKVKDELKNTKDALELYSEFLEGYAVKPVGRSGEEYTEGGKVTLEKWQSNWKKQNPAGTTAEMNSAYMTADDAGLIED